MITIIIICKHEKKTLRVRGWALNENIRYFEQKIYVYSTPRGYQ